MKIVFNKYTVIALIGFFLHLGQFASADIQTRSGVTTDGNGIKVTVRFDESGRVMPSKVDVTIQGSTLELECHNLQNHLAMYNQLECGKLVPNHNGMDGSELILVTLNLAGKASPNLIPVAATVRYNPGRHAGEQIQAQTIRFE